jgi:hypothetical protein
MVTIVFTNKVLGEGRLLGRFRRLSASSFGLAFSFWLSAFGFRLSALRSCVERAEHGGSMWKSGPSGPRQEWGRDWGFSPLNLEVKGESAPNGARRVHKKDRLPILPEDRNIPLGEQITDVD